MKADYFIYTGNAYPHKNIGRLIDAIILVKTKLKIISGRGIFVDRLLNEIKKKKAGKYVEVLGFIPDDELQKLYKNSIAFVFPTLAEGFGLPPKEAIEAGTIAIVSDIPVLKEVYGNSVFYFDPLDTNSITKSLKQVLDMGSKERQEKIMYSKEFVKKYSWSKMAKETLKIYESIK